MKDPQDSRTSTGHAGIRDQLAADRTVLANERTFLAYVRTSLGLLAVGLGVLHFGSSLWIENVLGWTCVVLSVAGLTIGFVRFQHIRHQIARMRREKPGPHHADDT